ncbi:MAG TPA: PilZ domain-containing protein [Gammaproteobacteria bacterium]|nr:PilZ domain-containing protein [Gammaproteobacteria bacterium]
MAPADYSEKRSYLRMGVDCPVRCVALDSGRTFTARACNLSAKGILLALEQAFEPGARLEIHLEPQRTIVPPLHAVVEVVRVQPGDQGGYRVGALIHDILS